MELSALAPTRTRMSQVHLSTNKTWTKEEDALLTQIATHSETISWRTIAQYFPNKTAPQLAGRWEKVLNPTLIKGSWTREEDEIILRFVAENGDKDWAKLALLLRGRTGKQCRERFKNHLDPNVSKLTWTEEEDNRLIDLHNKYGNHWAKIASCMKGRTDNSIKNRWNSTLSRQINKNNQHKMIKNDNQQIPIPLPNNEEPKYKEKTPIPISIPQPQNTTPDSVFTLKEHLFDDINSEPNGAFNGSFYFSPPPTNDNAFTSLFSPTNSNYDQFMEE